MRAQTGTVSRPCDSPFLEVQRRVMLRRNVVAVNYYGLSRNTAHRRAGTCARDVRSCVTTTITFSRGATHAHHVACFGVPASSAWQCPGLLLRLAARSTGSVARKSTIGPIGR